MSKKGLPIEISIKNEDLDKMWIYSFLAEEYSTYDIIKAYDLSDELLMECCDVLDKEVIKQINLSEEVVNHYINNGIFSIDDLEELTMITYSNLSDSFISKYKENINWKSIITYVSCTESDFTKWVDVIDEHNLWNLISANDLPIDFIRNWKDKLDWSILSIVKCFTEDEINEFEEYYNSGVEQHKSKSKISTITKQELTSDDIIDLLNNYGL